MFYFFNPKEIYKVIPLLLVVIVLTIFAAKILNVVSEFTTKRLFAEAVIRFQHDNVERS